MCDLEREKLVQHGHALTNEQKAVVIQSFPMKVILNEIARRDEVKDMKIAGCEQALQNE